MVWFDGHPCPSRRHACMGGADVGGYVNVGRGEKFSRCYMNGTPTLVYISGLSGHVLLCKYFVSVLFVVSTVTVCRTQ